ncbi:MAG: uL14 family ribosomal protein [Candidatus Aenigmarchaeota archaeon]|nr:uL14 family ribosomal protein [Candidatus Aenigmarchaeota archaeon]
MKAVSSSRTKGIQIGTVMKCADNSGANLFEVISVLGFKGKRRTRPTAGIADVVMSRVKSGNEKVRHQVFRTVIVRQRMEFKRPNGMRVSFEDNAGVVINDKFDPTASLIKGPIAKEVVERFKTVGKIASTVV